MKMGNQKLSWPVYLLFGLGLLSLLFSVFSFVEAHQQNRQNYVQNSSLLSAQVLAERMLHIADELGQRRELNELITEFDALQQVDQTPEDIRTAWKNYRALLPDPGAVDNTGSDVPNFGPLADLSDALAAWLEKSDAPARQIESADHLYQLARSVDARMNESQNSENGFQPLRARGPWLVYEQILNRFEILRDNGAITDEDTLSLLTEIRSEFTQLNRVFQGTLADLNTSVGQQGQVRLREAHNELSQTLSFHVTENSNQSAQRWYQLGLLSALFSLALWGLLAMAVWRDIKRYNQMASMRNERDQASILRLLNEISVLADGNLDVQATVSEDLTGAIADSVNYAVSELRRLVGAITNSADRVTVAVEETGASASQLAKASVVQSREIQRSSAYLKAMSDTMDQMSDRSREASQIAHRSVQNAVNGRYAVEKTIEGMNRIGGQIQQTSGLLQRLGESSQQIGDIVAVINKAAGRTRLLALNSAIQSNAADAQNSRFSEIADEVQSLADSLKHAAHDIEVLVQIIQDDARSAVVSMDHTATEVSAGNTLAEQAGDAHRDIETISRRLSVVVEHLSQKTTRQSEVVKQIAANMTVINDVTRQSAHGMQLSASALDDLKKMAVELRDGVADFVVPSRPAIVDRGDEIISRPLLKKREIAASVSDSTGQLADSNTDSVKATMNIDG